MNVKCVYVQLSVFSKRMGLYIRKEGEIEHFFGICTK